MKMNQWKSLLVLALRESAAAGVSTDQFIGEVWFQVDNGIADQALYQLDEFTRMTHIAPLVELDPRWAKIAVYAPIPMLDGERSLTNTQIQTIMLQCQVNRQGKGHSAFNLGFDDGPVAWIVARKRVPPQDPEFSPMWPDAGDFKDLLTVKTRFTSLSELVAWATKNPPEVWLNSATMYPLA